MPKLRVGLIGGGGSGNFFGHVHKRAISLDHSRELVAGALRSDATEAMAAAQEYGIEGFPHYEALIEARSRLELDYVTIVTPNHAHYAPAKALLEADIPVVCEKPITMTVEEAEDLAALAKQRNVPFVLAHTYTGHPMMMTAKEFVRQGKIGQVRKVEAWYRQGWLATPLEKEGLQQAQWRTDPARSGISNCGGDIGTHALVAATWTTGLGVSKVSARLNSFGEGRVLDDDFNTIGELENGGTAIINATQIAIGYRNDNGVRIFGTEGSLEWHQERAEALQLRRGEFDETYWLGSNFGFFPESVKPYLRVPAGHHEDFFEALGNLHQTIEFQIRRRRGEETPEPFDHPDADTGVAGMRFIRAAVESSENQGTWIPT